MRIAYDTRQCLKFAIKHLLYEKVNLAFLPNDIHSSVVLTVVEKNVICQFWPKYPIGVNPSLSHPKTLGSQDWLRT